MLDTFLDNPDLGFEEMSRPETSLSCLSSNGSGWLPVTVVLKHDACPKCRWHPCCYVAQLCGS
jgi:hypothetical protein